MTEIPIGEGDNSFQPGKQNGGTSSEGAVSHGARASSKMEGLVQSALSSSESEPRQPLPRLVTEWCKNETPRRIPYNEVCIPADAIMLNPGHLKNFGEILERHGLTDIVLQHGGLRIFQTDTEAQLPQYGAFIPLDAITEAAKALLEKQQQEQGDATPQNHTPLPQEAAPPQSAISNAMPGLAELLSPFVQEMKNNLLVGQALGHFAEQSSDRKLLEQIVRSGLQATDRFRELVARLKAVGINPDSLGAIYTYSQRQFTLSALADAFYDGVRAIGPYENAATAQLIKETARALPFVAWEDALALAKNEVLRVEEISILPGFTLVQPEAVKILASFGLIAPLALYRVPEPAADSTGKSVQDPQRPATLYAVVPEPALNKMLNLLPNEPKQALRGVLESKGKENSPTLPVEAPAADDLQGTGHAGAGVEPHEELLLQYDELLDGAYAEKSIWEDHLSKTTSDAYRWCLTATEIYIDGLKRVVSQDELDHYYEAMRASIPKTDAHDTGSENLGEWNDGGEVILQKILDRNAEKVKAVDQIVDIPLGPEDYLIRPGHLRVFAHLVNSLGLVKTILENAAYYRLSQENSQIAAVIPQAELVNLLKRAHENGSLLSPVVTTLQQDAAQASTEAVLLFLKSHESSIDDPNASDRGFVIEMLKVLRLAVTQAVALKAVFTLAREYLVGKELPTMELHSQRYEPLEYAEKLAGSLENNEDIKRYLKKLEEIEARQNTG